MTCAFCDIATGTGPATIIARWPDAVAFLPRERHGKRGCTDGHIVIASRVHVPDAAADPAVTGAVMARVAELAVHLGYVDFNIITSKGAAASQKVDHFHVHLVPRFEGDGLALPWSAPA